MDSNDCSIWWQIAKDMFRPHLAGQAAFYDVQTVWCQHDDFLLLAMAFSAFSAGPSASAGLRGQNLYLPTRLSRTHRP